MTDIISWLYFILVVGFFLQAIVWNIFRLYHAIKNYCWLKKNWSEENCFKYHLNKYYNFEKSSEEDIQMIKKYIENLKKQRDK